MRVAAALLALAASAGATEHRVADDAQLRQACRALQPGDVVLIAPGEYRGGLSLVDVVGDAKRPVILAGADRERPPVFVGGKEAIHLTRPQHVVLRDLVVGGNPPTGSTSTTVGRARARRST